MWAFLACLVYMGTVLSPQYTLSTRISVPEVSYVEECLLGGEDWSCIGPHRWVPFVDPGASAWQEMPVHLWFNKYKWESKPNWNPYAGSGYPVFLDGIYRKTSLIRQWLNLFPSDQGRDIVIFFRFLIWTWGIVFAVGAFGVSGIYLFFIALASTMLTYFSKHVDLIFLDVEMAVPWIFGLVVFQRKRNYNTWTYFLFSILGLWVGSQSFIQAQIVYLIIAALLTVFLIFTEGKRIVYSSLVFLFSFCLVGLWNLIEFRNYFSELISNRNFMNCVGTASIPWREIWKNSYMGIVKHAEMHTYFSVFALPLIVFEAVRNRQIRIFFIFFILILFWFSVGFPQSICQIEGIKNIHYERHLAPYLQSLFLILTAVSLWNFAEKSRFRFLILVLGFCLTIIPLLNRVVISVEHIEGHLPKEQPFFYQSIPETNIYSKAQLLSAIEDRRHFSPDFRLYPNFPTVFSILDMRVLYGSFPKRLFLLNDELFSNWMDKPFYNHADRFVGPAASEKQVTQEFEKLMLLHRVSMISLANGKSWLNGRIYTASRCPALQSDQLATLYVCSFMGGVGFFPKRVVLSRNPEESLKVLKDLKTEEALDFAVVERDASSDVKNINITGQGEIQGVVREKDEVIYKLKVLAAGYFVFADTFFPGWHAEVNGKEIKIFPANIAFKAVWLEPGELTLKWKFIKD